MNKYSYLKNILVIFVITLICTPAWGMKKRKKDLTFHETPGLIKQIILFAPEDRTKVNIALANRNFYMGFILSTCARPFTYHITPKGIVASFHQHKTIKYRNREDLSGQQLCNDIDKIGDFQIPIVENKPCGKKLKIVWDSDKKCDFRTFLAFFYIDICIAPDLQQESFYDFFTMIKSNKYLPIRISSVDTSKCINISDFAPIKHCSHVFLLSLSNAKVTESQLKEIFENLTFLSVLLMDNINNHQEETNSLSFFDKEENVKLLKNVDSLSLRNSHITDTGLKHICSHLTKLRQLDAPENDRLQSFSRLSNIPSLKSLSICAENSNDEEFKEFPTYLTNLRNLFIKNCENLTRFKWQNIKELRNLIRFGVTNANINNKDIEVIMPKLSLLNKLYLENCQDITDYKPLSNLTKLAELFLYECKINNEDFDKIMQKFSNLRSLSIGNCGNLTTISPVKLCKRLRELKTRDIFFTNESLRDISDHPRLESINITFPAVNNNDENETINLQALTTITNLIRLRLKNVKHQEFGIKQFEKLKNLELLEVECTQISCDTNELNSLSENLPNIRFIALNKNLAKLEDWITIHLFQSKEITVELI